MGVSRSSLINKLMEYGNFDINSKAIMDILARSSHFTEESDISLLLEQGIEFYKITGQGANPCTEEIANAKLIRLRLMEAGKNYYIAFYKNNRIWEGLKFGTKEEILARNDRKPNMNYCRMNFLEELYNSLLIKEKWFIIQSGRKDFLRLKTYLSSFCAIAKRVSSDNPGENFVIYNASKDKVLFDTNLLNVYGNRIILCHDIKLFPDHRNNFVKRFVNPVIIGNTKDAIDNGFDPDDLLKLSPFRLYSSPNELIFTGKLGDFDLEDVHHMNHIKFHRGFRLPSFIQEMDQVSLYYLIKNAVELALKHSSVNYKYIVPSYSISDMKCWFLIPIYSMGGTGRPSCALLINNLGGKWTVYTVLELEQAYLSARLIAPPSGWLDI